MHKSASKKNKELSIVQAVDNHLLTKTEKLKFYNQCKKTTRQKLDVVNLGMLFFFLIFVEVTKKNISGFNKKL